jgi:hypothetical protein
VNIGGKEYRNIGIKEAVLLSTAVDASGEPYIQGESYKKYIPHTAHKRSIGHSGPEGQSGPGVGGVWRHADTCIPKKYKNDELDRQLFAVARRRVTANALGNEIYTECTRNFSASGHKIPCLKEDKTIDRNDKFEARIPNWEKGQNVVCRMEWPNEVDNTKCCAGITKYGLSACGPFDPDTPNGMEECSDKMQSFCDRPASWSDLACPAWCEKILNSGDTSHKDYDYCRQQIVNTCLNGNMPSEYRHLCWSPALCPNVAGDRAKNCDALMAKLCNEPLGGKGKKRCACIKATEGLEGTDGLAALACYDSRCTGANGEYIQDTILRAADNCGQGCTFIQSCAENDDCKINMDTMDISGCNTTINNKKIKNVGGSVGGWQGDEKNGDDETEGDEGDEGEGNDEGKSTKQLAIEVGIVLVVLAVTIAIVVVVFKMK